MTLAFVARARDPAIASYRYRVLAPIQFLTERGHAAEVYEEARFDSYRTVVFSKAYRAEHQALARRLRQAGKRVVLDLCDDHFFNPGRLARYDKARGELLEMIGLTDAVICSTPVLAAAVRREAGLTKAPAVAPDVYQRASVDASDPTPLDQPARLLWYGRHASPNAPAGMADLLLIRDQLATASHTRPLELIVCSDSAALFDDLFKGFPVPARYVEWSPASFAEELGRADAVLIPLSDNPFVAAKTHNRLSLALSAGVPVVADRLDSYEPFAPFCRLGDWRQGLEAVLTRPHEERARASGARAYLEAHWSARAVAPQWEAAMGLAPGSRRMTIEPGPAIVEAARWLSAERRNERPWLLVGAAARAEDVAVARRQGFLVMALGAAATRVEADLAYVVDAELIAEGGEALAAQARALLVPQDLHNDGWAAGRTLRSWAADLPVLRQLHEDDRLVRFALWTGGGDGVEGDFASDEVPLRLLAAAGVRRVHRLGLPEAGATTTGFEGLTTLAERNGGGVAALLAASGMSYGGYDPARAAAMAEAIPLASRPSRSSTSPG